MAPTTPFILTLDQGSHASRAVLYDLQGNAVGQHSVALEAEHPDPVRSEYPGNAPYETLRECIDRVLADSGRPRVLAAALACQRSSIACWDRREDRPLSPVISWQDRRTAADLTHWRGLATEIHERTGLRLSPHYGATKLRWCLQHLSAVRSARSRGTLAYGPLASRLIWQLTREHRLLVDPVNAARTLLVDHDTGDWSPTLIERFGIAPDGLPACVPSEYDFGHIPASPADIPLKLVTGDQSAALYAHGPLRQDTLYATLGTGAFLTHPTRNWTVSEQLLTGVVHDDGSATGRVYAIEGTVNGAGSALTWLREQKDGNGLASAEFERALSTWLNERPTPPLFLNGIHGLGTPFAGARLESRFIPSALGTNPGLADRAVAVIESIVFLLEENRRAMAASGIMTTRVLIGGGLSRLDGLCQRLADLSGLPVQRSREAETTGRGLAFLLTRQLTGRNIFDHETNRLDDFRPTTNPSFHARFESWQRAMREAMSDD